MVKEKVFVNNKSGLHVRPASILAKTAEACTSKCEIIYGNNIINAKSLLNIVSVAIAQGAEIEVRCTGKNEEADLKVLVEAIKRLDKECGA